ncbi:hypothetical protein [Rubrolithibacter danxiaensis]|uniref:hypothetical protein n=1 Tax=Rubrolithibacter danxiaensis TaxID=3390805 RepID=UPI003BF7B8CC
MSLLNTYRINIPSSGEIVQELKLDYTGEYSPANAEVNLSESVPLITADCPNLLQYFPLNSASDIFFQENMDDRLIEEKTKGKTRCVIICNSFDISDGNGERISVSSGSQFSFIAGVCDSTEDPFTGVLLNSCTLLSKNSPLTELKPGKQPFFLKKEEINPWLTGINLSH